MLGKDRPHDPTKEAATSDKTQAGAAVGAFCGQSTPFLSSSRCRMQCHRLRPRPPALGCLVIGRRHVAVPVLQQPAVPCARLRPRSPRGGPNILRDRTWVIFNLYAVASISPGPAPLSQRAPRRPGRAAGHAMSKPFCLSCPALTGGFC